MSELDSLEQARAACILEQPTGGGAVRCAATREAGLPLTREALLGLGASNAALRRLVATFSAEDQDPEVLVLRIWRYVVEHVVEDDTAWLSVRAVDALAAGQGERAVTALALLWAAGLDAALALTEPVDSGATSVDLANPRVLLHRLVRVRMPGRDLFLDPPMGSVAPGFLLPTVLGQTAWVIGRPPGFERVVLPREQPGDERRTIVVEPFVDGRAGLTGTWTEVSRAVDAAAYREVLKSQPRSDWNKRLAPFRAAGVRPTHGATLPGGPRCHAEPRNPSPDRRRHHRRGGPRLHHRIPRHHAASHDVYAARLRQEMIAGLLAEGALAADGSLTRTATGRTLEKAWRHR